MKKLAVVILGVFASFALTILSAQILLRVASDDVSLRFMVRYVSSPIIAVAVGALVGLATRDRVQVVATVAALSLVPWTLWVVLTTNWNVATLSQIALTILSALVYLALGISAAAFVAKRVRPPR